MQQYTYFVFILSVLSVSAQSVDTTFENNSTETTIFAEILKNVTEANNIIVDLITNYKKLERIYNNLESKSNEYTLEMDDGSTSSDSGDDMKDKRSRSKHKKEDKDLNHAVTEMILSESETADDSSSPETKHSANDNFLSFVLENDALNESVNNIDEQNNDHKTSLFDSNISAEKVSQDEGNTLEVGNNSRRVKRMFVENFFTTPNVLYKLLNRPIRSSPKKELYRPGYRYPKRLNERKRNDKIAVIIIGNMEKDEDRGENIFSDTQESENEERRRNTLRTGCVYCLKSVIRKCYKALKASSKRYCEGYSCKNGFKQSFQKNSKAACVREFSNGNKTNNTIRSGNNTASQNRTIFNINHKGYFIDLTRGGYLDLCEKAKRRSESDDEHAILRSTIDNRLLSRNGIRSNILRDKYERRCQKASNQNCKKACAYAMEMTCANNKCDGRKKNKMKKICKSECKMVFDLHSSSEDDDSSRSSSSSGGTTSDTD